MQVTLEVPEDLAMLLGESPAVVNRTVLEALALESLRDGKLTVAQCRRLLGIGSRYEMDGFLKTKGLLFELTPEEVERDAQVALSFRSE